MPDWSYQTVFRPILFRLAPTTARDIALGFMGRLARLPLGCTVIDFLGHMRPDPRLSCNPGGLNLKSPLGLGCGVDAHIAAPHALARFGFGYLEIGPLTPEPTTTSQSIQLDIAREAIVFAPSADGIDMERAATRLASQGNPGVPVFARIADGLSLEAAARVIERIAPNIDAVVLPIGAADKCEEFIRLVEHARNTEVPTCLAYAPAVEPAAIGEAAREAVRNGTVDGILVDGSLGAERRRMGADAFEPTMQAVRKWRDQLPCDRIVIASGGIHDPTQSLEMLEAGADLVQIDSGLIFTGPGLAKRTLDAILRSVLAQSTEATQQRGGLPARPAHQAWLWALIMGLSMLSGGTLALVVACTRVVLPYDELMSGLSREQLNDINDRLLSFMQHDRVTLAGTMMAVGILYSVLAWWAIRLGQHWAQVTVACSAFTGFFSFFLFLGFGYFDPFHAFVTVVLLQFLLLMIHSPLPTSECTGIADLRNDWKWKTSQWGQLLFIIHGAAIVTAGIVISSIGVSSVFVPEDVEFMRTSAGKLWGTHPQLVPLVAHDRASFGGMLISCGVAVLLSALWGFQRGNAWLWWALVLAGSVAYLATIAVHWHVGYMSLKHLMPAYGGLAVLWLSGVLCHPYLADRSPPLASPLSEK